MTPSGGRLAGKVALVTGASSGIGAATAKALAREGMRVALLARRKDRLESVAEEIRRGGGHALVCVADVTDATGTQAAVDQVVGQWTRIDCLVNNAGRGLAAPFEATGADELRALLELNLVSVLTTTQAVLPGMLEARSGHIVNVSSVVGRRGVQFRTAYSATKFALVGLTECLRQELMGTRVYVSLVYPISTATEFQQVEAKKVEPIRRGPVQSAEHVAGAIVRCLRHPRPEVYPYRPTRILAVLSALAPSMTDRLMTRLARR